MQNIQLKTIDAMAKDDREIIIEEIAKLQVLEFFRLSQLKKQLWGEDYKEIIQRLELETRIANGEAIEKVARIIGNSYEYVHRKYYRTEREIFDKVLYRTKLLSKLIPMESINEQILFADDDTFSAYFHNVIQARNHINKHKNCKRWRSDMKQESLNN